MPRRVFTVVVCLALFWGMVWLPMDAGEKLAKIEIIAKLKGHTDAVYAVAYSPDGRLLATASFDNTLKLWDGTTGDEVKTYGGSTGHTKQVISVAFSPEGAMLASGGTDNTVKVWDVPMNVPARSLKIAEPARAVALSADGTKLAIGGTDGALKLVTPVEFKEIVKFEPGHKGAINALAFSANGQLLASAGADRTLRYWNVLTGQLLATVGGHTAAVNNLALHPNGTSAYSVGDDGALKLWGLPPVPAKMLAGHTAPIRALALTSDGAQFYTGGDDKTVRHFAVAGAKEVRALTGPAAAISSVATHPANTLVAAGTQDSRVFVWNAADGKPMANWLAHAGTVRSLQVLPSGSLMSSGDDGLIKFWTMPPRPARTLGHPDAVLAEAVSPDGKKVYTGASDKILRVWDTSKQAVEKQFMGHTAAVTAVALSTNLQILASGGADRTIRLWNQSTAKESDIMLAHGGTVTALAINPAGNQMLSASEDGTVKLWQLPLVPPKAFSHADSINCLALSADGSKMLTGAADKIVRLWNLTSGAKERDYSGPGLPITSVAGSRNAAVIAAVAADKSVTLWNAADGKVLHKLALPAVPQTVAFNADGQSIFVALADNRIQQIKTADGKDVKTLVQHKGPVVALELNPKGDMLFSGSADSTIQSWSLPEGTPKAKFTHVGPISAMALSKDGTRIAAVSDKLLKVWNVADGKDLLALKLPAEGKGIGFSPTDTRLIVACADNLARIYEGSGTLLETLPHDGAVRAVAFVDAKRVVSASADKLARLWTSGLVWQRQHQGPVRQALFTSKGDQIVSAGDDKAIKIWNVTDGKEVKALVNESPITHLALSADATRFVTAGADKNIKVRTLADGKTIATLALPGVAQSLALTPNGQRFAVALFDGAGQAIRVHDIAHGKDIQVFTDHAGPVPTLQFLGNGGTLVTGSLDKTARLLDVGVVSAIAAHPAGPTFAHASANGAQLLTAGADKVIKLWDLPKAAVLKTFGPVADPVKAVLFSKDFQRVGVAAGKAVKVFTVADGKEIATLGHPADVLALSFSQDGTRIATGAADKQTRLWELATGKELQFFPSDHPVDAVALTANNLVVSAAGQVARVETVSIQRVIAADAGPVHGLAITPANTHVLTAGTDKSAKLWNLGSGAMERAFTGATGSLRCVAVSKNSLLVAAGGADQAIRVYQFADAKQIGAAKTGAEARALAFAPSNLTLVGATADRKLQAWNVPFTAGQPLLPEFLQPAQGFDTPDVVSDFVIAADSASVYGAGQDPAMHVWKLASPVPTRNFAHPAIVDAVAFQPGGPLLASACHDGKVRLFDLVKNAVTKEIIAHIGQVQKQTVPNPIYSLTFSADGKQLLTSSYDNSIKLWDVAAGTLVREFKAHKVKEFEKGHQEPVYTAAFSPDGKFIASGSSGLERGIKIWNVADGTVVRDLANSDYKIVPGFPPASHPGAVTNLRFTRDGKYLISVGDAPENRGFLAVWDWQAGKLLVRDTLPLGVFYGLAIAPDQLSLAVTAGNRDRRNSSPEFNATYLLKMPALGK